MVESFCSKIEAETVRNLPVVSDFPISFRVTPFHQCPLVFFSQDSEELSLTAAKFHSLQCPEISIVDYVQRLRNSLVDSEAAIVCALILVDRILNCPNCPSDLTLNPKTVHRFLLTAFLIACKYLDDSLSHPVSYFAEVRPFSGWFSLGFACV